MGPHAHCTYALLVDGSASTQEAARNPRRRIFMLCCRIESRRQRQVAVLELKAVKFQGDPIQVEGQFVVAMQQAPFLWQIEMQGFLMKLMIPLRDLGKTGGKKENLGKKVTFKSYCGFR